jgi:hypothetical protein
MIGVQSHPGQVAYETLSQKNLSQKRAGGVAQAVKMPVALSSNPSAAKKTK